MSRFSPYGPQSPSSSTWPSLFDEYFIPSADFRQLCAEIFNHLDRDHSGSLIPEAIASFVDLVGFTGNANQWRHHFNDISRREPQRGVANHLTYADHEIKRFYDCYGYHYILRSRGNGPASMPCLTLQGFTDFMSVEVPHSPSQYITGLNTRVLPQYNLDCFRSRGVIPLSAVPREGIARNNPQFMRRINDGNECMLRSAREENDRKMMIATMGNQAMAANHRYFTDFMSGGPPRW